MPHTIDAPDVNAAGNAFVHRPIGIQRAVGQFFARTAQDRVLVSYFAGDRAEEMRRQLIALLSVALGDPAGTADGGARRMTRTQSDLHITDAAFDRVLGHLNAAFVDAGTDDGTSRRVLVALSGMRTDIVSI